MNIIKLLLLNIIMMNTLSADVINVKSLKFVKGKNKSRIIISLNDNYKEMPNVTVKDNIVQLVLPNSNVWPKIDKDIDFNNFKDTKLLAYQFDKKTVRIRAILPFKTSKYQNDINVFIKDKSIILEVPSVKQKSINKVSKKTDIYDEGYLNVLLAQKVLNKKPIRKKEVDDIDVLAKEDSISIKTSAVKKESSFSMMNYFIKFLGFLGIVLLLFYGIVTIFKKSTFSKGKLGFLNGTKVIDIINTTYLGPKRNLMLVKVHNKVLLLGSSENGINYLSEIEDYEGIIKTGEREITGSNFDSNLQDSNAVNKEFKIKEILSESTNEIKKERLKLGQQIKNKVKSMKSFQQ